MSVDWPVGPGPGDRNADKQSVDGSVRGWVGRDKGGARSSASMSGRQENRRTEVEKLTESAGGGRTNPS